LDIDVVLGQAVSLPDGARLATDIYRPKGRGDYPVVLLRPLWDSRSIRHIRLARYLAVHGIVAVIQAVRGTSHSSGAFLGPAGELEDTRRTLQWIQAQDWFSGRLCPLGICYSCYPALVAAQVAREMGIRVPCAIHLVGGMTAEGGSSSTHRGGALRLHWALPVALMLGQPDGARGMRRRLKAEPDLFSRLDLADIDLQSPTAAFIWRSWLSREPLPRLDDDVLRGIPTLTVSGWYDFTLDMAFASHRRLGGEEPDGRHVLVVGPWDHNDPTRQITQVTSGLQVEASAGPLGTLPELFVRWIRTHNGAADTATAAEPGVHYTLGGAAGHEWTWTRHWGGKGVQRLYLQRGDGTGRRCLSPQPGPVGRARFTHDPLDPVPTLGGAVWPLKGYVEPGPADQSPLETRPDIVIYDGAPLQVPLTVVGDVRLELTATAGAAPADFTAKLVDVGPDGYAAIVADGILRTTDGAGVRRRLTVDIGPVAHEFAAGHRIRLEVAAADFPKYDRAVQWQGDRPRVVDYTLFEGGPDGSCLVLPGDFREGEGAGGP